MTPAHTYIASLYERAVDAQLHIEAIRSFLASHGIRRSPAQVAHDLTHAYAFHGYAELHPAPPVKTAAQLDAELGP